MSKYLLGIFTVVVVSFFAPLALAEEITDYNSDLFLGNDGVLHITETIHYDFGAELKHGITRTIPTAIPDTPSNPLKERYVDFSAVVVTRDGMSVPYTEEVSRTADHLVIGDPNVLITGKHTYKISYTVRGAVVHFTDGYPGIYWNAIGTDWLVPIQNATAVLRAPAGVLLGNPLCYSGVFGQTDIPCVREDVAGGEKFTSTVHGFGGLTIEHYVTADAVSIEKLERLTPLALYGGGTIILLLVFGTLLYAFKTKNRGNATVIAEYEPFHDVLPMHAGYLIDGRLDARDITAAVMYLAQQGYIKIERLPNTLLGFDISDYRLTLLKEYPEASFLDRVTNLLFVGRLVGAEITISQLKKDRDNAAKRYATNVNLKRDLHYSLLQQGYFEQPFGPIVAKLSQFAVISFAIFYVLLRLPMLIRSKYVVIGTAVVAFICLCLYLFSERRSALGYEAKRKLEGFKLFLSVTGRDRFAFLSDPRNNPDIFVEYLPYAVAFGVEKQWATVFADVVVPQPNWYADANGSAFNAVLFTSSLDHFSTNFSSSLRAASTVHSSGGSSGSFGGGFSGGGGGGGGGGSW